ncbi:complement factor H-related protein 1-like isoform X3 [Salvelinus alpinus]|uniref:complement factor H-related protein 1-like isoform X3 n=1 Tax=Salvelinus alpinus TaxID=8036 RepID=UPI0039FCD0D2
MGYLFCREMGEPKCLFFVLLIWCLGTVHGQGYSISAQDSQQSCQKLKLDQGYFDSDKETYQHGTELYYACDKGRKPVVEGWWAMVKCENRKWSHIPQCIDENSCIAPENPNAKVKKPDVNGWYPNRQSVWFDCDSTHVIKGSITAKCENGTWTKLPLCVERDDLCGEPPLVTNAVITRKYQEKFQDGSKINYKCQDSYTFEETDSSVCISGDWTTAPTCKRASTGEGDRSTSSDRGNGGTSSGGGHSTSSGDEASPNVRTSARPQPSSPFLPVDRCGEKPTVDNGDFISDSDSNRMALTFKCINYYKLVGPEQVMCRSDQTWSELPICKAPCTVDKRTSDLLDLKKDMFVKEGESQTFLCKETGYRDPPSAADVRCQNGQVTVGRCTLGCKLDTWNHHWLDLTEDMFVKEGRQTWACKKKDYRGRRLVANVECQRGYVTASSCYLEN